MFWKDLFISVGVFTEKVHNSLAQFPHSKKTKYEFINQDL